jgi:hypothetical protein
VHREDGVEDADVDLRQGSVDDVAGVVDHDVNPPELVHGRVDCPLAALDGGHVAGVGDRRSPRRGDLAGYLLGGSRVVPGSLGAAAEVVDDDLGTALAEQQRVGPADAASRAGDDRDPAAEIEGGHRSLPAGPRKNPA